MPPHLETKALEVANFLVYYGELQLLTTLDPALPATLTTLEDAAENAPEKTNKFQEDPTEYEKAAPYYGDKKKKDRKTGN